MSHGCINMRTSEANGCFAGSDRFPSMTRLIRLASAPAWKYIIDMPLLTWPAKNLSAPEKAVLIKDSIIYPGGIGYPDVLPDHRLILGDNLPIMAALIPEYEGRLISFMQIPILTNRKYPRVLDVERILANPKNGASGRLPRFLANLDVYLIFYISVLL